LKLSTPCSPSRTPRRNGGEGEEKEQMSKREEKGKMSQPAIWGNSRHKGTN